MPQCLKILMECWKAIQSYQFSMSAWPAILNPGPRSVLSLPSHHGREPRVLPQTGAGMRWTGAQNFHELAEVFERVVPEGAGRWGLTFGFPGSRGPLSWEVFFLGGHQRSWGLSGPSSSPQPRNLVRTIGRFDDSRLMRPRRPCTRCSWKPWRMTRRCRSESPNGQAAPFRSIASGPSAEG